MIEPRVTLDDATPVPASLTAIPAQLRIFPHWVTWRFGPPDGKGKSSKLLYVAGTNHFADSTNPSTWTTFDDALAKMNGFDAGLGFVLTRDVGVTGIDLDTCIDAAGNISPWARGIMARIQSYTERSPMDGLHLFVAGLLPEHHRCKLGDLELYTEKRFLTMTGNWLTSSPATIEPVDVNWLYDLMTARVFDFTSNENYARLMAGDWQGYRSQSEAELALCGMLHRLRLSASEIDCVFRMSGLYREKWDSPRGDSTYGAETIATALGSQSEGKKSSTSKNRVDLPVMELPHVEQGSFSTWPVSALEGDYIADLTHALTNGTSIPSQYVRETIGLTLGAMTDGFLFYPGHELPTRRYACLISDLPAAGKGVSFKRVHGALDETPTFLGKALAERGIKALDGGLVGSGQYLAQVVETSPNLLLFWDELSELLEKASQQSSTLLSALKKLYESNSHWSGSFANKKHGSDSVHLSVLMHSTLATFTRLFTGKGVVGDGLLSRFTLVYAPNPGGVPDWTPRNYAEENRLAALLVSQVPGQALVPAIDQDAHARMNEFLIELQRPTHPHAEYVKRLDTLTKIDLLQRAVYSSRTSEPHITLDAVNRSIAWAEHQLKLRLGQWTVDSGRPVEAMIQTILRRLEKGPATEVQLKDAGHVFRSGSHETFSRAMNALCKTSEIQPVGQTHKRTTIFALVKEDQ
jgi:hypothetical protein